MLYSVSHKKSPPKDLWQFFQNGWEFFNQILHAYYEFQSTLDYKFLFNYLQIWQSYAILIWEKMLKNFFWGGDFFLLAL